MNLMKIFAFIKSHAVIASTLVIVAASAAVIGGRVAARNGGETESISDVRRVSLAPVSQFRGDSALVSVDGTIESVSQVDIKSQLSAPLSSVRVAVGDSVSVGQVIAELSNADIRAQLDQARASLALAEGQYGTSGVSVDSARKSAIDAINDSRLAVDEVIRGQVDQFLFNTAGEVTPLVSYITDQKLKENLQAVRIDLTNEMTAWEGVVASLSSATTSDKAIYSAIAQSKAVLSTADALLSDMSRALNDAVKNSSASTLSTLEGWKAIVTAAKSSVSGANAALTAADAGLLTALSSHGSPAEAQISAAQAGVRALEAQLAKTVISSPISGKIAALPLRVGEFAAPGQLIATVVGGGGLEAKTYASGEDLPRIVKGASVLIQGSIPGVVKSVAPSVSQANKKAEVRISITDPAGSGLVVGQNVRASIQAAPLAAGAAGSYFLPIQNVKIVPGDAYVFTIDENSKTVKHSVILGRVEGDLVEITSGLADDMQIAFPVYGLEEGREVSVE